MIGSKIQIKKNNFFNNKWGERNTPFMFFYIFPMFTVSRTVSQEHFSLYIGWLYWNLKITYFKNDN